MKGGYNYGKGTYDQPTGREKRRKFLFYKKTTFYAIKGEKRIWASRN